jgi:hypothetical protein
MALLDDPAGRHGCFLPALAPLAYCHSSLQGIFCVRYSLDRNGGFLVDWSESCGQGGRNFRRAKIVTVKRGYCWAVLANTEEMDAQRPDVFPNIAQMVFALRLQLRIAAKLPPQNTEDALLDLKDKGLI